MFIPNGTSEKSHDRAHKYGRIADCPSFHGIEAPTANGERDDEAASTDTSDISQANDDGQCSDANPLTGQDREDTFVLTGALFITDGIWLS